MKFRSKAFGLHLAGSALALTCVLGSLYFGWYRWPGWYLTGASHVALLLTGIDVVLGPLLTLIIANPRKPRRELARDIGMIVLVQVSALTYGAHTLWAGRPLYYTFSNDRLELVQASEISPDEVALARKTNPAFAPYWYSRPRWVWAPLPDDPEEAKRIMTQAVLGGTDVVQMPRYFRPWDAGLRALATQLRKLEDQKVYSPDEKRVLRKRMAALGLPADEPVTLTMWGYSRPLLAVFDPDTLRLRSLIRVN